VVEQRGVDRRSVAEDAGEQERAEQRMILQGQRLCARQVLPLETKTKRGMAHSNVVRERAAHQAGKTGSRSQRAAEQSRGDHRRPDGMLVAGGIVPLERFHLVPHFLRVSHLRQHVGRKGAHVLAPHQVLQRGGLERLENALGASGLEEGALAQIAGCARCHLFQPAQIDDFAARRYQPTVRREEVPGQDRPGQGEVHHALEGPGRGEWARAKET
jgi:hypothetical protein